MSRGHVLRVWVYRVYTVYALFLGQSLSHVAQHHIMSHHIASPISSPTRLLLFLASCRLPSVCLSHSYPFQRYNIVFFVFLFLCFVPPLKSPHILFIAPRMISCTVSLELKRRIQKYPRMLAFFFLCRVTIQGRAGEEWKKRD